MGFVQADPIRAPGAGPGSDPAAPGHRDTGWAIWIAASGGCSLEEDFLYAYGFMPPRGARSAPPASAAGRGRGRAARAGRAGGRGAGVRPGAAGRRIRARSRRRSGGSGRSTPGAAFRRRARGRSKACGIMDCCACISGRTGSGSTRPHRWRVRRCRRRSGRGGLVMLVARVLAPVLGGEPAGRAGADGAAQSGARHAAAGDRACCAATARCGARRSTERPICGRRRPGGGEAGVGAAGGAGCSRRSTRWSGIGGASSIYGGGPIGSRRMFRRPSASAATTRCRCCGATCGDRVGERVGRGGTGAGGTGFRRAAARSQVFTRALEAEIGRMERFLAPR